MGEKIKAEDILPQLRRVRRSGRGWVACCPAHDDRRQSLSIANGDRGLMLHCFTGCPVDRIRAALGIRNTPYVPFVPQRKPATIQVGPDLMGLWDQWEKETDFHFLDGFAMALDVDTRALQAIGCAWSGHAWAFPMRDASKRMIGIRLRASDGKKWAVKGSHQGMFIPSSYPYCIDDGTTMYVTEGPTDLAAAMTLGLYSIGRASCQGQEDMVIAYLRNTKARRLVIVTDNDTPGLEGARKLQSRLRLRSCIYTPPTKDLREFAIMGGDANLIETSIRDLVW